MRRILSLTLEGRTWNSYTEQYRHFSSHVWKASRKTCWDFLLAFWDPSDSFAWLPHQEPKKYFRRTRLIFSVDLENGHNGTLRHLKIWTLDSWGSEEQGQGRLLQDSPHDGAGEGGCDRCAGRRHDKFVPLSLTPPPTHRRFILYSTKRCVTK